jgi:prepilin-type N-terminal cleavage/methylation domain-containing protein
MFRPSHNRRSGGAFTLVEIMVVVVIIGLLAAVAMPTFRQVSMRSKATATVNDIRQFSAVFLTYSHQNGRWPAETDAGVIPTEVTDSLPKNFSQRTPIGGLYDWDYDVSPGGVPAKAAITITSVSGNPMSDDAALVEYIDNLLDDGVLTSGNVQYNAGSLVFIIER